jgi:hypothetical protein
MLLSWSLASALDLINDSEVAGEFPHVVPVASMRREKKKMTSSSIGKLGWF